MVILNELSCHGDFELTVAVFFIGIYLAADYVEPIREIA
jgi:hypothetical protein